MTDQPKRSRWKRRAIIAFVLLLPVQYVLLGGSIWWLYLNGHLPPSMTKQVWDYQEPLFDLCDAIPAAQPVLDAHMSLWTDQAGLIRR